MRFAKLILIIFLLVGNTSSFAHVGSPGVIFQGKAGPYNIMVYINPPDVIPGTATTAVYIDNKPVNRVYLAPIYWNAGEKGIPKSDEALQTNGAGPYQCMVWIMQSGVSNMRVTVEGPLGKGSAIIPVMVVSTAERAMPVPLLIGLGVLLLLLGVLMITIIGACVADATVPPGNAVKSPGKKKVWAMVITGVFLFISVAGGVLWWYLWREYYRKYLYQAPLAHTSILWQGNQRVLKLSIDSVWLKANHKTMNYVVPDHGKIMHLFLVRENTDDVFAHLHPIRTDSINYVVPLPDLPPGRYWVFGDIVKWNGFSETIRDSVTITDKTIAHHTSINGPALQSDPDDTYVISNSVNDIKNPYTGKISIICGKPGTEMKLADGSTATWQQPPNTPFENNTIYQLTFSIIDPSGKPAKLQPYMGMMGHAVVMKYDGSVYVHLHPVGNYSMASQQLIQKRISTGVTPVLPNGTRFIDSIDRLVNKIKLMSEDERNLYLNNGMKGMAMPGMTMSGNEHGTIVSFPYSFPSPGNYRIWIQMKRDGKILNSAFDAVVE